jgi:hypothetical protein
MMQLDMSQIARISREEKLLLMEALWADLSRTDSKVESPEWHEAALNETENRLAAGDEKLVDWDEAKTELRKRFD